MFAGAMGGFTTGTVFETYDCHRWKKGIYTAF